MLTLMNATAFNLQSVHWLIINKYIYIFRLTEAFSMAFSVYCICANAIVPSLCFHNSRRRIKILFLNENHGIESNSECIVYHQFKRGGAPRRPKNLAENCSSRFACKLILPTHHHHAVRIIFYHVRYVMK